MKRSCWTDLLLVWLLGSDVPSLFAAAWKQHDIIARSEHGRILWQAKIEYIDQLRPQIVVRNDGSAFFAARFNEVIRMTDTNGSFSYALDQGQSRRILISFDADGRVIKQRLSPLKGANDGLGDVVSLNFIANEEVILLNRDFAEGDSYFRTFDFTSLQETGWDQLQVKRRNSSDVDLEVTAAERSFNGSLLIAGRFSAPGQGRERDIIFEGANGTPIVLHNGSMGSNPNDRYEDIFFAEIRSKGEARWAKQIWNFGNFEMTMQVNENDLQLRLLTSDYYGHTVFEPLTSQSVAFRGELDCLASYLPDGNFIEALCNERF